MKAFFLRIIAWHKKNNPGFLDRLNFGIESYDVLNFFTTNSLVIPNELIELYSLSNGSNIPFGDQYDLFPGYYFLSFQDQIIKVYHENYYRNFFLAVYRML
jgi:hypothetical protein